MRVLSGLLFACLLSLGCSRGASSSPSEPPTMPPGAPAPAAAAPAAPAAPESPTAGIAVLDDERRCTADSDCTLTTADCCGCQALGKQVGVRKDKLVAVGERRAPVCTAVACAQAISDDPSCSAAAAVCRDGLCAPATGPATAVPVEPIR